MNTTILQESILFKGLSEEEISEALKLLKSKEACFDKGDIILQAGSVTEKMGLVLEGSVTIESNDVWGNKIILSHVGVGRFFAETYALLKGEPMQVDVSANEDCRILFLNVEGLRSPLKTQSPFLCKLTSNLLMISVQKNLHLSTRSFHVSPKTIRGKLMAYLNTLALQTGSNEFDIPFDRQQLADYLNLERTALSKELSKMQKEGYFTYRKNHFLLLKNELI